jgi:hypothetical protein
VNTVMEMMAVVIYIQKRNAVSYSVKG